MHTIQKPFGIFEVVKYAFSALVENWKAFLLTDLLISGLIYIASLIASSFDIQAPLGRQLIEHKSSGAVIFGSIALVCISLLMSIIVFILFLWFYVAYAKLSLNTYDGQVFDIKNIISSYRSISSVAVASLIKKFFVLALGMAAFAVLSIFTLGQRLTVLSMYLWIELASFLTLLAMWLYIKTSFSTFFIVDRDCSATESLRLSYRLTQGRFWLVAGVNIVVGLCALLLMLLLGLCISLPIGALFGMKSYLTILITRIIRIPFYALIMCGSWYLAQAYMFRKLAEHYALQRTSQNVSVK